MKVGGGGGGGILHLLGALISICSFVGGVGVTVPIFSSESQCFCFLEFLWRHYSWYIYLSKKRSKKGSYACREMAYELKAGWKEGGGVHQFVKGSCFQLALGNKKKRKSSRIGEGVPGCWNNKLKPARSASFLNTPGFLNNPSLVVDWAATLKSRFHSIFLSVEKR